MCCDSDFGLSEDDSSEEEGEEIHAYRGSQIVAPEEVAALREAFAIEPNRQESCWEVMDAHWDNNSDADDHEIQIQGG